MHCDNSHISRWQFSARPLRLAVPVRRFDCFPRRELLFKPLFRTDKSNKDRGRKAKILWSREFSAGAAPDPERLPRTLSGFLYRQILERRGVREASDFSEGRFAEARAAP